MTVGISSLASSTSIKIGGISHGCMQQSSLGALTAVAVLMLALASASAGGYAFRHVSQGVRRFRQATEPISYLTYATIPTSRLAKYVTRDS